MERNPRGRRIPPPRRLRPDIKGRNLAEEESDAFEHQRNLERETEEREHERKHDLRDLVHWVFKSGIMVIGAMLIFGLFSWGWHLLAPLNLHWLKEAQLIKMKDAMSSALIAVFVSDYARKYF